MSKFCKTCNTQVDDSLAFCPTCGNKVEEVAAAAAPANSQPIVNTDVLKSKAGDVAGKAKNVAGGFVEKMKSDKLVLVLVVILAAIVLFVVGSFVLKVMQPGYGVANSYLKAYYTKPDAEKVVSLMHEDVYEEEDDAADFIEEYVFEDREEEDIVYTSYKIVDSFTLGEEALEDEAKSLEENYDIDEDDVQAVKRFFVKMTREVDGEKQVNYTYVEVAKIDGKWYINE